MITFKPHSCGWGPIWLFLTCNMLLWKWWRWLWNWFLLPKGCSPAIFLKAIPSRSWVVPGKYSPQSTHSQSVWAYLSSDQLNEPIMGFRLENVLVMCLDQGPMPSGLEALCCTTSFRDLYLLFNFIKPISTNQVYMIPSILLALIFLPIVFFTW